MTTRLDLTLHLIRDLEGAFFQQAIALYATAFPPEETRPPDLVAETLAAGVERMWVAVEDDRVMAVAVLFTRPGGVVLLDFFAVVEDRRGNGTGSRFLQALIAQERAAGARMMLIEVDEPEVGPDREMRLRRMAFYRRLGARELVGVRHRLPPSAGEVPVEMRLMAIGLDGPLPEPVAGAIVRDVIAGIFVDLYHLPADDPLLRSVLSGVPAWVVPEA